MVHRAGQDVRDRFDPAVRMPWKAGDVVVRVLVPKVVEQEERVEITGVPESEGALQPHARALHRGFRLNDSLEGSDRHGQAPVATSLSICGGLGAKALGRRAAEGVRFSRQPDHRPKNWAGLARTW